ncbi:MAG: DUF493 domain-containing protein [Victivallaceae bacterium]|nr:DUF493 domain-containing protein [Victivallaceae bacterium]
MNGREITFPADWEFRVIIEAKSYDTAEPGIRSVFMKFGLEPKFEEGRTSSTGAYRSVRAGVAIESRDMLDAVSAALVAVPGVKMLL